MALEFLLLLLLVGVWGITGYVGNHLKYLRGRETRFRGWLQVTKIGVGAGMVLFLLWVLDILLIGINFGWLFVMDRSGCNYFPSVRVAGACGDDLCTAQPFESNYGREFFAVSHCSRTCHVSWSGTCLFSCNDRHTGDS
ncbi:hypothetical protein D3C76_1251110 [compost metagenome]